MASEQFQPEKPAATCGGGAFGDTERGTEFSGRSLGPGIRATVGRRVCDGQASNTAGACHELMHPSPLPPQELKLKDKECERLSKVREQLEQELEELTASLFEVPASSFSHHFLS